MTRVELPDLGRWAPQRTDAQRWEPPRKLTVVVAPHPDDETLLSGGLIAHQARAGVPVIVLAVTDGEAAYPCLLYTSPSPRDRTRYRMPSSA